MRPLFVAVPLLAIACSTAPPSGSTEVLLGANSQPIIGGSFDTTHQAVVYLVSNPDSQGLSAACTGTIIKTDAAKKVGWVLTAAHCVNPKPAVAIIADDVASKTAVQFIVLDATANPAYTGQTTPTSHDVAMVRILGVDASTPTIPLTSVTNDAAVGTSVTSVGYGRTTPSSQPPDNNSRRKRITRTLNGVSASAVSYSLSGGGICQGDSGGPVLVGSAGSERVLAVHSYVSGDCLGDGTSIRVSGEMGFINGELSKALPSSLNSCSTCGSTADSGNQACAQRRFACGADADCSALLDCLTKCSGISCQNNCRTKYPAGLGPFAAYQNCTCAEGCKAECASDNTCVGAPQCGIKALDACGKCGEGSCCAERAAASFDKVGFACVTTPDGEGCAANAPFQAYQACLQKSCSAECGLSPSGSSGGASSGSGGNGDGTTTTTTTSGCNASGGAGSSSAGLFGLFGLGFLLMRRRRHA